MVWDWRRWVLENLTDWESRVWPFPFCKLFLFRSKLVALCVRCYLQQSCLCERGAGTASPEYCVPFVGSAELFLHCWCNRVAWRCGREQTVTTPYAPKTGTVIKQCSFEDENFSWAGLYFLRCMFCYTELEYAVSSCFLQAFPLSEVFMFAFNGVKSDCGNTGPAEISQTRGKGTVVVVRLV